MLIVLIPNISLSNGFRNSHCHPGAQINCIKSPIRKLNLNKAYFPIWWPETANLFCGSTLFGDKAVRNTEPINMDFPVSEGLKACSRWFGMSGMGNGRERPCWRLFHLADFEHFPHRKHPGILGTGVRILETQPTLSSPQTPLTPPV